MASRPSDRTEPSAAYVRTATRRPSQSTTGRPVAGRSVTGAALAAAALAAVAVLVAPHAPPAAAQLAPQQVQVQAGGPGGDAVAGKENNQNVFVRDSAIAQEKFENAKKMERQKQWNNAASFYQEVLEKYAGRVVPAGVKDGVIVQYTSIANGVRDHLCHWPQEGLDVYRAMNEPKAAALLEAAQKAAAAGQDDSFALHEVLRLYFVTDAGKAAAVRLIDEKMERGEFAGAAWLGDELLNLHPNLVAERPMVLFRTALAYHLAGDAPLASSRATTLADKFPTEVGVVRGKDAVLTKALEQEMAQSPVASTSVSADSWPMVAGNPQRDLVPAGHASPGTRLAGIPLAKPDYKSLPQQQKNVLLTQFGAASESGMTLGVLPVVDRGEMFFQDGMRVYAVSLESGVPLPGWVRTHGTERQGQYVLPNVWGSTRGYQQTLTLTDRQVLAVMGQPDNVGMMQFGMQLQGEARLVCLDRETGKELWVAAPTSMKDVPKNDDEKAVRALQLSGSPLVVGDNVLVIGRAAKPGQGEDCYVLAFDLANGHYRWGCYIASSGMQNVMWNMPQMMNTGDSTSHLAYSNGRVYVLTNLGAVAALDAYSGTIVWLDIYPTDRQAMNPMMMRGMFNPMMANGSMGNASKLKPWMYNPIVIHEGKLFVLPTEGPNLLIYDAGSGKEEKRINLDQLARWDLIPNEQPDKPTTLVGVRGDKLVLAGDSRVLCLNWRKYDEERFPGPDDDMIFWPSSAPDHIRGRCFMTEDSVFVPGGERLRRLDMKTGSAMEEYPKNPRNWEEGESPGNVLVSGDQVVLAGASAVNIYTDLVIATAKLDREIAAAPRAPEPRLRYAEMLFAAGRGDDALSRLDEAVKLMGGPEALEKAGPSPNRDRVFSDALTFAAKALTDERAETKERAARYYDRAGVAAFSPQQQVNYRMARADFAAKNGDPAAAVKLYQEILADAQMRVVPVVVKDEKEDKTLQADGAAEKAIEDLIRSRGAEVYAVYQEQAKKEMEEAQADKDHPDRMAEKLLNIAQGYPNSGVAPQAMMAAADAYEHANQPHQAVRVLRQMLFKYGQQGANQATQVGILEAMARNYLAITDRNRADMISTAAARLAQAAQLPNDPKLSQDLKLPDGKVLPAGTPFAKALDDVRAIHGKEAAQVLPDFRLPQPPTAAQKAEGAKYPKPFVGQTKSQQVAANVATVLPGVSVLVPQERDFPRADRVVAWGAGTVAIFPAGQDKPSVTVKAFPSAGHGDADAPRGVAWMGDSVLVWGGSRLVCIDAKAGKAVWDTDVNQLGTLEVVRTNDGGAVAEANNNMNGMNGVNNAVIIRQGLIRQRMLLGGNGQVVIQGGVGGVGAQPAGPEAQAAPDPNAGEQVAEVRPVGDRVLVSTTTGRLLSAELSNGHVAWQTRLSERAPERLVATEDFTVAKVSDDLTCRLIALDTYTGSLRGSKPFSLQNNNGGFPMAPVNLALSPDGTLVYTLPDRLRLKNLFKPWDEEEKDVPGPPGQPIYAGAKLPGQLVISEGRILAVADNAPASTLVNQKWVRVHSLETGQPLSLRYTAPDGSRKEVDRILAAETNSWNVMLRVVGSHLYVIGPNRVFGYNLDKPSETWRGTAGPASNGTDTDMNFKDAFVGQQHLVVLDQPPSAPQAAGPAAGQAGNGQAGSGNPTQYRLLAFARRPSRENDPNSGESGRLDYPETVTDPAGISPTWQACDGGFYYATADGKVRMLLGGKEK